MLVVSLRLAISMNVKAVEPLEDVEALTPTRVPFLTFSWSLNSNEPNRFLFLDDPLSLGRGWLLVISIELR